MLMLMAMRNDRTINPKRGFLLVPIYPKNRILVKIDFAGRFRLQKCTVFRSFPFRFSCSPTNNLNTSSRLGTHKYLDSLSYRLQFG